MLTIRQEQMVALVEANWIAFAGRAEAHLREYFPDQCRDLGRDGLRAHVLTAIGRVRRYGFFLEADIFRYLNVAMVLGWDFERNPLYPWASEILQDELYSPETRVESLFERAIETLNPEEPEAAAAVEEEEVEALDGLEDEEMGESIDGDTPEPIAWEPEEPEPVWDPEPDDVAAEADTESDTENNDGW